jgi:Flp pilus assembly protein TadB
MGTEEAETPSPPHETPKQRVDRELIELLNELRVAIPGVQVLFAFLLTVPLSDRFGDLDAAQHAMYFVAFAATTAASVAFMAPTAYHRLRFRQGDKERMLRTGNRSAIVGTVLLAIAMTSAALLVGDLSYGPIAAAVFAAAVALLLVGWWFALPLLRRARGDDG